MTLESNNYVFVNTVFTRIYVISTYENAQNIKFSELRKKYFFQLNLYFKNLNMYSLSYDAFTCIPYLEYCLLCSNKCITEKCREKGVVHE